MSHRRLQATTDESQTTTDESQTSHTDNYRRVTNDFQACNFIKKRLNTGVSMWNLRHFQEHLFYRTPPVAASQCPEFTKAVIMKTKYSHYEKQSLQVLSYELESIFQKSYEKERFWTVVSSSLCKHPSYL